MVVFSVYHSTHFCQVIKHYVSNALPIVLHITFDTGLHVLISYTSTMVEAYSEEACKEIARESQQVSLEEKHVSVLLLAAKWQFDTFGLSAVNKSLVSNLRLVDPDGKIVKITCAVVAEEIKIGKDHHDEAKKYKVILRGAKPPRGRKEKPDIHWLDHSTGTYYHHLLQGEHYDFVIGHAPYLANGCFNFKDIHRPDEKKPKVILIIHGFPKTEQGDIDEEMLTEWLTEADAVFSVGKTIQSEIMPYITALEPEQRPKHKMYIPGYPLEHFDVHHEAPEENKVRVTQNVAVMSGERKDLNISGLDFPLTVAATAMASEHILGFDGMKTNLIMLAARNEDTEEWKEDFKNILQDQVIRQKCLKFQCAVPDNIEKLKSYMRKSNLFVFPSEFDSPVFGIEVLAAVAAGVPVLVSEYSGMASLLESLAAGEPVVKSTTETWKDRIIQKLINPKDSQRGANQLKEQLLVDSSIACTHLDFIKTVTGVVSEIAFKKALPTRMN